MNAIKIIKGCVGELKIGEFVISCAVLEDETRVLVSRSVANVLGKKGGGAYWKKKKEEEKGALMPEYISAKYLQPYISPELRAKLLKPIVYINQNNIITEGLEATILPEICDVWIKASQKGALTPKQQLIAERAYILLKGFAHVGITALVDEATGFQALRDRNDLQKILARFLSNEKLEWAKRFPDEFYMELFRLRSWQWRGMGVNRPQYVGKLTNQIVYERLAPGLLAQLKIRTPKDSKGQTGWRMHQWLTNDFGVPKLREHLFGIIALMRASSNSNKFIQLLQRAYPKIGDQQTIEHYEEA